MTDAAGAARVPPHPFASRLTDVAATPRAKLQPLPVVDWSSVGRTAPKQVQVHYEGPDAPLPKADVAVLTWTSAEWSALDHVFLTSGERDARGSDELVTVWHQYSLDAGGHEANFPDAPPLWGFYALVEVTTAARTPRRVLLFNADAHLAHSPWVRGLIQMTQHVLDNSGCSWIYSIGTAGGNSVTSRIGDVAVTNAGHVLLKDAENQTPLVASGSTVTGPSFPSTDVIDSTRSLLYRMGDAVTEPVLETLFQKVQTAEPSAGQLKLTDLVNEAIDPSKLGEPDVGATPRVPLLTTDYYFIASGDDSSEYAVLEMDDSVIGVVAQRAGKSFTFVRNVSDPIVPNVARDGTSIGDSVRTAWSAALYQEFGLLTSLNSALVTWAAIAG
jgi:nucleoside phosphorylase